MKYLKIYESFKDDYISNYRRIRSEYDQKKKENFQKTKELIDENIYDLIDFNLVEDETKYNYHDFSLEYVLKFDFVDFETEFDDLLENLKLADKRVREYSGFDVYFQNIELHYTTYIKSIKKDSWGLHEINFGFKSTINDIIKWRENRDNYQKEALFSDYRYIKFKLIIQ